jgi:hypothetical protein
MNKKQTAVEWLELELSKLDYDKMSNDLYLFYMAQMFDQAREMEKEQIEDAYVDGAIQFKDKTYKGMKEYYNETYGE